MCSLAGDQTIAQTFKSSYIRESIVDKINVLHCRYTSTHGSSSRFVIDERFDGTKISRDNVPPSKYAGCPSVFTGQLECFLEEP